MSEKILHILEKKRSKYYMKFVIDPTDEDEWFILVQTVWKKNNKLERQSMIIRKDIPNWLSYLENYEGWKIVQ
jgi:hypothetical protein